LIVPVSQDMGDAFPKEAISGYFTVGDVCRKRTRFCQNIPNGYFFVGNYRKNGNMKP